LIFKLKKIFFLLLSASQNEKDVGLITFGEEDNTNCKEFSYAPLAKTSDWSVDVQCVKVGDTECAGTKKTMTILDDELLMLAPQQVVEEIAKIMKLKPFGGDEDNSGMYVFPQGSCEAKNIAKLPTITITVGEDDCEKQATISITPKQYLQYVGLYTGGPRYKIVTELILPQFKLTLVGYICSLSILISLI